jgi:dihydroorotate dehydrogenase
MKAGATLIQSYTGFIYGGPMWPRRLQRELVAKARAANLTSIVEVIGSGADAS